MSEQASPLDKILNDATRQQIIILFKEKGSVRYSDLMDKTGVLTPSMMDYHLNILADLIQRTALQQYALTEKGKAAYKLITESNPYPYPNRSGGRLFFVAAGTFCIGFTFWLGVTLFLLHSGLRWAIIRDTGNLGDDLTAFATLICSWILGGFIGDFIGKRRDYKIPIIRIWR
jgi:hypothetical protein